MKVYIATFFLVKVYITTFLLILPFAYGFEFASAKGINLCARKFDGGSGFGRVSFTTESAACRGEKKMHLWCQYTHPTNRIRGEIYDCEGDESCVPHEYQPGHLGDADAGCIVLRSPSGVKGSGDTDNHACSSGINIGNDDIYILSSISPDDSFRYLDGITTCIISKSGSNRITDRIYSKSPCPKTSTLLKLAKKTTYQACVFTALSLAKKSVGFTWHISSPGKLNNRRGLEHQVEHQGKSLSEMFTIVSNNTTNDAVQIVIGD
ncbi:hypothetical protein EG328_001812 [Venturia inaequalis]|uniref:Uncharacterized protein n=1 Tax=Venturia inaequalis TaxID=5025 RepID=A0A8H3U2G7_VENIN|nr:hypothetical protein EG328_001812 [Venturia inaequalis]